MRTLKQTLRAVLIALVVVELAWVLVANAVLASGLIQKAASAHPESTLMEWDWAFSPWPGRAYVKNFRLRVQDPDTIQFRLTVERAHVDVHVLDLLHREFHGNHVRAEGVTFRLLAKVEKVEGNQQRLDAFPKIEGFARPALKPREPSPPSTPEELAQIWSVRLDDCDAHIDELWFLEYRYLGLARAWGSFELKPLRWLWVGGALNLGGGALTLGPHFLADDFKMELETTILPVDLTVQKDQHVLSTLTAHVRFDTPIRDFGAVAAYVPGLAAHGAGRASADLRSRDGKLEPGSKIDVRVADARVDYQRWHFIGTGTARLSVPNSGTPLIHSTVDGMLGVPLLEDRPPIQTEVHGFKAELALANGDFSQGLLLGVLQATAEGRVADTWALTEAFNAKVPLLGKPLLGDGPLVAIASAQITPGSKLVRVRRLAMGRSSVEGAIRSGPHGWRGAASGHFASVPVGFRLQDNRVEPVPLVSDRWLDGEFQKDGIAP